MRIQYVQFLHILNSDGKNYKIKSYNLDAIISVGYRVNSKQATQFRIWATKTLKDHLLKGYTINEKRLLEAKEKLNLILEIDEVLGLNLREAKLPVNEIPSAIKSSPKNGKKRGLPKTSKNRTN